MRIRTWDHAGEGRIPAQRRSGIRNALRAVLRAVALRLDWARQRRLLAGLSDNQLKDVGLTRAQVASEAQRPYWFH